MPPPTPENAVPIFFVFGILIAAIVGAWVGVIVRLALGQPVLPREKPRIVPWGGKSVVVVVLAWFAIQVAVPVAYRVAQGGAATMKQPRADRPALSPGELMTLSGLGNVAILVVIPLLLAATSGASLRDFGIGLAGLGRRVFQGAVAYPLIAPLVFGVMLLSVVFLGRNPHPLESAIQLDRSARMATILVLAGVVLAPLAEELIFRGVLLGWLTKVALGLRKPKGAEEGDLGEVLPSAGPIDPSGPTAEVFDLPETPTELDDSPPPAGGGEAFNPYSAPDAPVEPSPASARGRVVPLALANVAVSIIFAGLHAAVWPTPIPLFFLSLGLGLLYQQTGSIVGPVVLHMIFNGVSTLIMFLALSSPPAPPTDKPKPVNPVPPPARVEASDRRDVPQNQAS